jgi:hypothetical protein
MLLYLFLHAGYCDELANVLMVMLFFGSDAHHPGAEDCPDLESFLVGIEKLNTPTEIASVLQCQT